ncbi:hypothetical protein [Anaeromyxobacter sp. PSR-1]|uniref:hypothetical protein n=1 Tax=unclassified Anaeromyxobacter TaxID=2620896 RepID=UPI0005DD12FD|nr:hypothetical protein [Anaeromyxobacter sp. PSR-1]GAO04567.1 hypothetical protein PSR1_03461 [Anaeromyxobacter sp. PSR-1]
MNTWSLVPMLLVENAIPADARRALHASLLVRDARRARAARALAGRMLVAERCLTPEEAGELVGVDPGDLQPPLVPLAA